MTTNTGTGTMRMVNPLVSQVRYPAATPRPTPTASRDRPGPISAHHWSFPLIPQLVDFAHARSANARATVQPSILGATHSHMHPDTASSDLYERFEAMCAEVERDGFVDRDFRPYVPPRGPGTAPPRPPTKSIEVAALFDARVQVGDQRGRQGKAVWSDKSAPPKKGPLRCLFGDYAARDDVYDLDDTNDKPSLMSRAEAFQLAHDFDIVGVAQTEGRGDGVRQRGQTRVLATTPPITAKISWTLTSSCRSCARWRRWRGTDRRGRTRERRVGKTGRR